MVSESVADNVRPAERSASIRVGGLTHRAGPTEILRDIGFEVDKGTAFGLIGPPGAGKTTALRAIATLLVPGAGRIEVDGLDASVEPRAVRRRIGFLGADEGVYAHLSVREHLEFYADAQGVDRTSAIPRVLATTDLVSLEHRSAATLSRAMRQRLHLARLLLGDPAVLILDEPATDLDRRARIELAGVLSSQLASDKTILFGSRRLDELTNIAASIAVLHAGRVVLRGAPREIVERAESRLRRRGSDASAPRTLKLRVLAEASAAAGLLRDQPDVVDARATSSDVVLIEHVGSEPRVAELVRHLVTHGMSIVGLAPEKSELDNVLVKIAPERP